jgi:hypothetical protein
MWDSKFEKICYLLAEALGGVMSNQNLEKIFPEFKSQWVGLTSNQI